MLLYSAVTVATAAWRFHWEDVMKKVLVVLALGAATFLFAPEARAEFIIGASYVEGNVEEEDFEGDANGWKAHAGFRFFKFFGVEGSYTDYGDPEGDFSGSDIVAEVSTLEFFGVGVIPLGFFEIFGKAGYGMWDVDISDVDFEDDGWDLCYGAGFAIKFKFIGFRAEYEAIEISDIDTVDKVSAGVDFRF